MSELVAKQSKFSGMVANLIQFAQELGYQVTLGEAWRTKEQAEIYAKQGKGIKASKHCQRLAIDLNFFRGGVLVLGKENLETFGLHWEALGGIWGGRFKRYDDSGHFEI
jgi:hypothetical protein